MSTVVMAVSVKRKAEKSQDSQDRKAPPLIPTMGLEKSRQISNRGRKLLIERYAAE